VWLRSRQPGRRGDSNIVRGFFRQDRPSFPNYRQESGIDADTFYPRVNPGWQGTMPDAIFYGRDGRISQHSVCAHAREEFEEAIRGILATPGAEKHFSRLPPVRK
jgi:hypothetical protein